MLRPSRTVIGLSSAMVLVALLACKKKEESSSSGSGTATTSESLGIPECDEYLTKYEKCIKEKVPEASRGALEQSMKQTRDTWKKLADNPVTKAGLAQGCKQALDTAKTAMGSYGCQW
jgi:hypothetical protein